MKVILIKDVPKVGHKFDTKEVKPGFGQNFLIKNDLAVLATPENISKIKKDMDAHLTQVRLRNELLEKSIADLSNKELRFTRKVNEKGHVFDKVDVHDIRQALQDQLHLDFSEKQIHLDSPIKEVGEALVRVAVGDKGAEIKIIVEEE